MGSLNSYYALGNNDYLYAKAGLQICNELGNYNSVAAGCAQAAEKMLKAIIEQGFTQDDFSDTDDIFKCLKSHNLRALYNVIIKKFKLTVSSRDLKWLGDFYYDARYPGDYFIEVNEQDAIEALDITERVKCDVDNIMQQIAEIKAAQKDKLSQMSAFRLSNSDLL